MSLFLYTHDLEIKVFWYLMILKKFCKQSLENQIKKNILPWYSLFRIPEFSNFNFIYVVIFELNILKQTLSVNNFNSSEKYYFFFIIDKNKKKNQFKLQRASSSVLQVPSYKLSWADARSQNSTKMFSLLFLLFCLL